MILIEENYILMAEKPGCAIFSSKRRIEKIIKVNPRKDKNSLTKIDEDIFCFKIIAHKMPEINSQALVGSKKKEPALPSLDSMSAKIKLIIKIIINEGMINFLKYRRQIKINTGKRM